MLVENFEVPKRTHQITIQTVNMSSRESKSFSLYASNYTDKRLFNKVVKLITSKKLKRPTYFDTKNNSHIIIIKNKITKESISKCFPLHQYSIHELHEIVHKGFFKGDKK